MYGAGVFGTVFLTRDFVLVCRSPYYVIGMEIGRCDPTKTGSASASLRR